MNAYYISQTGGVVRASDGAFIPENPDLIDYAIYLEWVAEGNTATPYATPTATWASFQQQALETLQATDITVHRIAEAVALNLTSWNTGDVNLYMQYRRALRLIVNTPTGTPGTLPAAPPYPAGT